jgi:hypothetical protein
MRLYYRKRDEIFALAARIGVPVAAIWFVYRPAETWNYFDVVCFHHVILLVCIFVSFLPLLSIYLAMYCINLLLIRIRGSDELRRIQEQIIQGLIRAYVAHETVEKKERDLIAEYAWASLRSLWRPE